MKEILIDVDSNETAELVLIADHKFDEEAIIIKITPARADNPLGDFGVPTDIQLIIKNDRSYVEEEPSEIDLILLLIFLVIIVLIIFHILLCNVQIQQLLLH